MNKLKSFTSGVKNIGSKIITAPVRPLEYLDRERISRFKNEGSGDAELIKKLSNYIDKNKTIKRINKKSTGNMLSKEMGGKSLVNTIGILGPDSYNYLSYIILFFIIICIILLILNKSILYNDKDEKVTIRMNKNIFYIYVFTLFLLILQLYILKDNYSIIVNSLTNYGKGIELFNIIFIIGLTIFFYEQISSLYSDCPYPNKEVCEPKGKPNEISDCELLEGPYKCGDPNYKPFNIDVCDNISNIDEQSDACKDSIINNNFKFTGILDGDLTSCSSFSLKPIQINTDESSITDLPDNLSNEDKMCIRIAKDNNINNNVANTYKYNISDSESIPCINREGGSIKCGLECCVVDGVPQEDTLITKRIKEIVNDIFSNEHQIVEDIEQRLNNMSPGSGIPGPPGPPGPPGISGSDSESIPNNNQYPNLICPNEPGGICAPGQTRCNDDGFCEGFALISLKDKIDMQKRFSDLNSNSYKANNLMNNLESFLLNSLK